MRKKHQTKQTFRKCNFHSWRCSTNYQEQFQNKGDRVLCYLPERSDEFLNSAIDATKNQGIIHYYSHIHADKKTDAAKLSEKHFLEVCPVKSKILNSKLVRAVGPRYYQTVVDVKITK